MMKINDLFSALGAAAALFFLSACNDGGDDSGGGSPGSNGGDANRSSNTASETIRDQIRIVGSSTVYPFSSYVAEEFGSTTDFKTPVVESTGSGGGHKLFYGGVGKDHPDITNSSRRIKSSEFDTNQQNGVTDIVEIKVGFDGIAIAQNKNNPIFNLTLEQISLAVAEKVPDGAGGFQANAYQKWNEIDPSLPDRAIVILGPPTTSGTRDAFHELVLHEGAEALGYPDAMDGKDDGKVKYQSVRQDGKWVDSGENDNLIVQKLTQDPNALGIFGYSFLAENDDKIAAVKVNDTLPNMDTISSADYPVSRSLFFYVKKAHIGKVPGLAEYVDLFLNDAMIGPDGILKTIGLVPLPDAERAAVQKRWNDRVNLAKSDLE